MRCPARPAIMMVVGKPRRRTTARLTNHASSSVTDSTSVHGMNNDGLPSRNGKKIERNPSPLMVMNNAPLYWTGHVDAPIQPVTKRKRAPSTGRADRNRSASARQPDARASTAPTPSQRTPNNTKNQGDFRNSAGDIDRVRPISWRRRPSLNCREKESGLPDPVSFQRR